MTCYTIVCSKPVGALKGARRKKVIPIPWT
jgi:hypothetical protein